MTQKLRPHVYNLYNMVKYALMLRCDNRSVTNGDIHSTLLDAIGKLDLGLTSAEYSEIVTMLQRRFDVEG